MIYLIILMVPLYVHRSLCSLRGLGLLLRSRQLIRNCLNKIELLLAGYAIVFRARINHLKTELYTNKKGADSVEKYMLKLKALKDQLVAAGEVVSEIDLIVVALASLSAEFNMIHTMIVTRETPISLKEYRAQLLVAERNVEESQSTLTFPMSIMYCQGESTNAA
ncbi:hypothetical protein FF2_022293 [Malus domestica]